MNHDFDIHADFNLVFVQVDEVRDQSRPLFEFDQSHHEWVVERSGLGVNRFNVAVHLASSARDDVAEIVCAALWAPNHRRMMKRAAITLLDAQLPLGDAIPKEPVVA